MDLDTALDRIEKDIYDRDAHISALEELLSLDELDALLDLLVQSHASVNIDPKFFILPKSRNNESIDKIKQMFSQPVATTIQWHIKHLEFLSLVGDSVALFHSFKQLFTWRYRPRRTRSLWEILARHFISRLDMDSEKQLFKEAYLFVLGLPHFQQELTFSEFKDFLYNNFDETTPKIPQYQAAIKLMQKIEQDGGEYIMSQRFHNNQNDAKLVLGCMMETVEDNECHPRSCEQVLQYLGHVETRKLKLFKNINIPIAMKEVAQLAVRTFPRDGKSWFNAALAGLPSDVDAVLQAPYYSDLSDSDIYYEWSWLVRARLLQLDKGNVDIVDNFVSIIEHAQSEDVSAEVAILGFYMRVGESVDYIRSKFKHLTKCKPRALKLWKLWIEWERRYPKDTNSIQQVYQLALKQVGQGAFDDGREIVESYKNFLIGEGKSAVHNLASCYFNAGFLTEDLPDAATQQMEVDALSTPVVTESNNLEDTSATTSHTPTRDREHLTVILAGLSDDTDEDQIRGFFSECGEPRNISITSPYAVVEFSTSDDKLTALTRDYKILKDKEVRVTDGYRTTVYVTNFDVNDNSQTLREQFGAFGEIVSLRMPSLSVNKHRRFCYIQYTSSTAAEAAVQYGKDCDNGIVVEISDPSRAKQTKKTPNPNATVYISRLNYDTSAEELKAAFEEFGEITKLVIPNKGQDLGTKKNIGFAFLSFATAEAANASLVLNGSDILGKDLQVSIADKQRHKRARETPATHPKEKFVPKKRKVLGVSRATKEVILSSTTPDSNVSKASLPKEAGSAPKSNADFRSFLN